MKINTKTLFKILVILIILCVATVSRIKYFDQAGNDAYAYKRSVEELLTGINPYRWTIASFNDPDDPSNHGYAYLPLLLYFNSFFYILSMITGISFFVLSKIPILLADLGVGIILIKYFYKKNFWVLVISLLCWFLNPYFFMKSNYVYTDPLAVFFSLAALYYLGKDDILSGALYAMAVATKPFSIIFLPLFLFRSKDPIKLILSSALVGLFLSIPFMHSVNDFMIYLRGAVFIHGDRVVQGRPFLFFISYFGKIELVRIIPIKVYAYLSLLVPWILTLTTQYKVKNINKYVIAAVCLLAFLFITPVLNRTYLMWAIPILSIAIFELTKGKLALYTPLISIYWTFYYVYLLFWKEGFHNWHP